MRRAMGEKLTIPKTLFRTASFDRGAIDEANRTVELSISSDEPYERWFGVEILDHSAGAIRMDRLRDGAPLLFNHDRSALLGKILEATSDGKRLRIKAKIAENDLAQNLWKDIVSGVLSKASVGYSVEKMIMEEEKDGVCTYRCTEWTPYEGSLVTIPADNSVGVGRGKEGEGTQDIVVERKNGVDTEPKSGQRADMSTAVAEPTDKKETKVDVVAERKAAVDEFQARAKKINDFVDALRENRKIDVSELAKQYLFGEKAGASFDDFRQEVLLNEFKAKPVDTNGEIGASEKDIKQYSVIKALRDMAVGGKLEGLEREMSEASAKVMKHKFEKSGAFLVPMEVTRWGQIELMQKSMNSLMQRAQSAGSFTAGGALVAQEMQGLIEFLRNRTVLGQLGITILSGIVGDLVFPVQTGGATAYWVSETGALTDSEATFGNKTMTPHRLGATIPVTTQILAQSSISMENWVRQELDIVTSLKADAAGLQGTGTLGEPLGIANTAGINATVTFGGAAEWADVVEFETGIAADNADIGTMAFALSTASVGKWKTILRSSVAGASYLILDDMTANGYKVNRTNQITGNIAFFGVWAQLMRAIWAGRELIVDPYALKKSGQIEVTVNEMTDFLVRQPLAFNVSTDSAAQ